VDGNSVLADAVAAYRVALGERLVAAYALGSLAHGGFSELVSDVDLGLILSEPLLPGDAESIQAVAETERSKGSPLHTRLSVFWGTSATLRGERTDGRFPALDRLDLIENGRLLTGCDEPRRGLPRPSDAELLVTGAEFALDCLAGAAGDVVEEILSPDVLLDRGVRRLTKLVLFPVRFVYTAATGRVGTNDAAVAWYLDNDDASSVKLVAAALAWRITPPLDRATAAELLSKQMLPLYLYYIDDHIERLSSIDEFNLARAFQEWRDRLAS
jgi:hypothetical protein